MSQYWNDEAVYTVHSPDKKFHITIKLSLTDGVYLTQIDGDRIHLIFEQEKAKVSLPDAE